MLFSCSQFARTRINIYILLRDISGILPYKKVQVGNDQEMAQSEGNFHSKNRGVGKKLKWHLGTYTKKTYRKLSEQLFLNRRK